MVPRPDLTTLASLLSLKTVKTTQNAHSYFLPKFHHYQRIGFRCILCYPTSSFLSFKLLFHSSLSKHQIGSNISFLCLLFLLTFYFEVKAKVGRQELTSSPASDLDPGGVSRLPVWVTFRCLGHFRPPAAPLKGSLITLRSSG